MRKSVCAVWALCVLAAAAMYVFSGTGTAALLLAGSVLLPPAQLLLAVPAARRVRAEAAMPKTLQKGKTAVGSVVIDNPGLVPVVSARVDVEIYNMLTRERRVAEFSSPVMPRSRVELPFVFESAYCGQIVFTPSAVKICDFFGLFYPKARAAAPEPFHRLVAPELFSSRVRMSNRETEGFDEATRYLDKKGSDRTEIFQLRDYADGDNLSQIRWKLTAKHGKLIVADPAEPISNTLLVIWDGAGIPEGASPAVPDALAEAFVTLCVGLSESGMPFTLAWKSGNTGRTELKDIIRLEDIYDVVPDVLSPGADGGGAFDVPGSWPRAVYFSGRALPETYGVAASVSGFICVESAEECPGSGGAAVIFSPGNYRSELAEMII
jgi:hypothetical protein